jgi:hypothetical protein
MQPGGASYLRWLQVGTSKKAPMRTCLKPILLTFALASAAAAHSGTPAFARATVLGRAYGAAIACGVSDAERTRFRELADKELRRLAPDAGDSSDARTRMTLQAATARRSVESGSIGCGDALWFYRDQLKGLKSKKRLR